jgi:type II secretory ATPase GspE/PulE/Tfp pilus assembly ATPase PilB-like protein
VMVGEMRDRETAEIAVQAALTGHLVFSTLHTNDAPGGVTRLVDMGVEPYLVAATVQGLLAQRLVRLVCPECAEPYEPPAADIVRAIGADGVMGGGRTFRRGRGCDACAHTGYRGRGGLYELLVVTDTIRGRVVAAAPLAEIRALAQAQGMVSLRAAGWAKACAGITTIEEVLRVTRDDPLG